MKSLIVFLLAVTSFSHAQWLSNIKGTAQSSTSEVITWTSAVPASSRVKFGTTTNYGKGPSENPALVTQHSMTLANLSPGTLYHFRVMSNDDLNILVISQDVTFTTTAVTGNTLSASPLSIAFGNTAVGSNSAIMTTTLTNTGNATITFETNSISAPFSWGGIGNCNDPGGTLAPGGSCTFSAKFTPTAAGTVNSNLIIGSNASNPTITVPLSGTGTTTAAHSVSLAWNASPTAGVNYVVYRAPSSSGPFTSIASGLTGLQYQDVGVTAGQGYAYRVTAKLGSVESTPTNVISVVIP